MPTISLRLTEEEHAALKAWAHDSRRSLQKEAVWRLFSQQVIEMNPARKVELIESGRGVASGGAAVVAARSSSAPLPDPHFKPDFK